MEVFGSDFIFNDFRASDYDLTMCSFEYDGDSEDEIFAVETKEKFLGENPFSVYQGQNYNFKLEAQVTMMKSPCRYSRQSDLVLDEYTCRAIMRKTLGLRGYKWMKFISNAEIGEDVWYKARVTKMSLKRTSGQVVGIILTLETNSYMGYSQEFNQTFNLLKDIEFKFYSNSDDLNDYLYPIATIIPKSAGDLLITNKDDNNYYLSIKNVTTSEVYYLDGEHQIVKGNRLENFNGHWLRLVPGENRLVSNMDMSLQLKYRLPRKAGFICR